MALAAAAVAILVVGGLALLLNTATETDPAATTSRPTTVAEATPSTLSEEPPVDALPKAPGIVVDLAGSAEVVHGYEPFGEVSGVPGSGESAFIPQGRVYSRREGTWTQGWGGMVQTPTGYTALGLDSRNRPALARSADGITWHIIDTEVDLFPAASSEPVRLFEAGGWYWISMNEPRLYRSADSIAWEQVGLDGAAPGPLGVPITDQPWHEFDGRLVAWTGEGLLAVHMDAGTVDTVGNVPWELPPDGFWGWMTAIEGKLTVFVSSVPDSPPSAENPIVEQYETRDLPFPGMAHTNQRSPQTRQPGS